MKSERASTALNVAVFLLCTAMIAAVILPSIARQRHAARQSGCSANLRTIALGMHNYHSAFKQFPTTCGGTTGGETDESSNHGRLGVLVGVLPFVEQQTLWEAIIRPYTDRKSGKAFPSMGPVPWYDAKIYQPWSRGPAVYQCPERADNRLAAPKPKVVYTLASEAESVAGLTTNYVINYGDGIHDVGATPDPNDADALRQARATQRGTFMPGRVMKFRDILDGTANTIMMSETRASLTRKPDTGIAKNVQGLRRNPSLCLAAAKDGETQWWDFGRGSRWCDGALPITGFQTILPPNSPSCTSDQGMFDGVVSASSDHDGGVHVLFCDGRVGFVTNTIDAGDSTAEAISMAGTGTAAPGGQSPYGLWGALGTRASMETIKTNIPGLDVGRQVDDATSPRDNYETWTDKTGNVSLAAKFVRIIDKQTIELEDVSGTLHQVPLNTLRDKDIFRAVSLELMAK